MPARRDQQRGRLVGDLIGEGRLVDVDADTRDDVFHRVKFRAHFGEDADKLLFAEDDIVRPLDFQIQSRVVAQRLTDCKSRQRRDIHHILRRHARTQQNGEGQIVVALACPASAEPALSFCLLVRDDDGSVFTALAAEMLEVVVRRADRVEHDQVFAERFGFQIVPQRKLVEVGGHAAELVALIGDGVDHKSVVAQCLDPLPYRLT